MSGCLSLTRQRRRPCRSQRGPAAARVCMTSASTARPWHSAETSVKARVHACVRVCECECECERECVCVLLFACRQQRPAAKNTPPHHSPSPSFSASVFPLLALACESNRDGSEARAREAAGRTLPMVDAICSSSSSTVEGDKARVCAWDIVCGS